MRKIINGCELSYEIIGEGIPTLCIHGFFVDRTLMKGCLENSFRVIPNFKRIYIDLVGMGETPSNAKIKGSNQLLSLMIDFIQETIGKTPFLLIGESFGGYLSLALTKYFKNQILGMFLICPCVVGDKNKRILPEKINVPIHELNVSKSELEAYKSFLDMAVVVNEKTWNRYYNEIWVGVKKANENFLNIFNENYILTMEEEFTKINFQNPTVFLLGRQDHVVGFEDALLLMKNFPQGTFAVLNEAGHNLQIEQPELFDSFLVNFLKEFY